jgi:hypothetical protein
MSCNLLAVSDWFVPWEWSGNDLDELREWLIAFGTVGAVIVALFLARRQERRARARRPMLSLVYSEIFGISEEEVTYARDGAIAGTGASTWLRFNVSNEPGRDAAEDVELLLWRVMKTPDEAGVGRLLDISFPALLWTHAGTTRLTISPGVVRSVDIARRFHDPPYHELRDILELCLDPVPADGRHRLAAGTYDLELTLSARNANARDYWTRITFDPSSHSIRVESAPAEGGSPLAYE